MDKITADAPVLVSELAGADIVYLTGGNPANLLEGLRGSKAWQKLREMADDGTVLAGSSAGAMVLGERMAFGGEETEALGLVAGVVVLPHFERADNERIEQLVKAAPKGMTYLGIDRATGCLRVSGEWRVTGPGRGHVPTRAWAGGVGRSVRGCGVAGGGGWAGRVRSAAGLGWRFEPNVRRT